MSAEKGERYTNRDLFGEDTSSDDDLPIIRKKLKGGPSSTADDEAEINALRSELSRLEASSGIASIRNRLALLEQSQRSHDRDERTEDGPMSIVPAAPPPGTGGPCSECNCVRASDAALTGIPSLVGGDPNTPVYAGQWVSFKKNGIVQIDRGVAEGSHAEKLAALIKTITDGAIGAVWIKSDDLEYRDASRLVCIHTDAVCVPERAGVDAIVEYISNQNVSDYCRTRFSLDEDMQERVEQVRFCFAQKEIPVVRPISTPSLPADWTRDDLPSMIIRTLFRDPMAVVTIKVTELDSPNPRTRRHEESLSVFVKYGVQRNDEEWPEFGAIHKGGLFARRSLLGPMEDFPTENYPPEDPPTDAESYGFLEAIYDWLLNMKCPRDKTSDWYEVEVVPGSDSGVKFVYGR